MMGVLTVAGCLVMGSALVVAVPPRPVARHRLQNLCQRPSAVSVRRRGDRQPMVAMFAGALTGLAAALAIGGWLGLAVGLAAAVVTSRTIGRMEPAARRRARTRAGAELPFAVDLIAASLRAGAPVAGAVAAVADVWGGPLGERLGRVAAALWLGTPADEAWAHLADVDGAGRVVTAAVRSSESGAALADALRRVGDDLRVGRAAQVEAAARRAGVLVVLPLGLCFLPAFVIAGLAPLVIAILRQVAL